VEPLEKGPAISLRIQSDLIIATGGLALTLGLEKDHRRRHRDVQ